MPEARTTRFSGVWLPSVTPFVDAEVDYPSYEPLVGHYVRAGVAGLIPLGTTGESPTVDEAEAETLIERTVAAVAGRVPSMVGATRVAEATARPILIYNIPYRTGVNLANETLSRWPSCPTSPA